MTERLASRKDFFTTLYPRRLLAFAVVALFAIAQSHADERSEGAKLDDRAGQIDADAAETPPFESFRWVNRPPAEPSYPGLRHATFESPSMRVPVGYNIYLPPGYADVADQGTRYPVLYYLHGGRPGSESKSIILARPIHEAIRTENVRPMIVVWVNGGRVSHYDYGDSAGESVFVNELIPHVDATYRTIATRGGRALQGFSQGGRGATRIMFKYPELFISAAPGGPGYAVEKQIFENDGVEEDERMRAVGAEVRSFDFGLGNDAYSRAIAYASQAAHPKLRVLIWVGDQGFNYEATLEYLGFLYGLGLRPERLVAPDVAHNPLQFYQARGTELLAFHDRHWDPSVE